MGKHTMINPATSKIAALPRMQVWLANRPPETPDQSLWEAVKQNATQLSFDEYEQTMDLVFGKLWTKPASFQTVKPPLENPPASGDLADVGKALSKRLDATSETAISDVIEDIQKHTLFNKVEAFKVLKAATEVFLLARCGIVSRSPEKNWKDYTGESGRDHRGKYEGIIPYLRMVQDRVGASSVLSKLDDKDLLYKQMIEWKLEHPCMTELIWSYWMEEALLVQTINAIVMRFENRTAPGAARLRFAVMPHGFVSHLLWGFIGDIHNQLTLARRNDEYLQQYGIMLQGKAVPEPDAAESRSKFLEAFHNVLYRCRQFYRQADDKTVEPDAFPVLNALVDVHLLLTEGMDNQFGDLPFQARKEMMMMQYILAQPEMQEFLGGRVMMDLPELWMDRVETMKQLQGWSDTPVLPFWKLATFGEEILLSIRYHKWTDEKDQKVAANWALDFRSEIQGYIHSYEAVTGVDLTAETADPEVARLRALPPAVHLSNRLAQQQATRARKAALAG